MGGGVKVLSNPEIARSLRNGFRASLGDITQLGRATWNSAGGFPPTRRNPTPNTASDPGSQSVGGEASCSRGKEPRPPTKAPKSTLSGKGSGIAVTAGMLA